MRWLFKISLSLWLLTPAVLWAQMSSEEAEISFFELESMYRVVTASKIAQKVSEAPASVEVITAEQIARRGYTNLEELLHDLPGFNFAKTNGVALSTIYPRGYRSSNTDRLILMVDGVEETDLWKGVVWLDKHYPLSNIKQVEVVYGPASALYGANAFQGVINVITKDGADIAGAKLSGGYGAYNTFLSELNYGRKFGDTDIIATFRKYDSDERDLTEYDEWDYVKPTGAVFKFPIDAYQNDKNDWAVHVKIRNKDFTFGGLLWDRADGSGATYVDVARTANGRYQSDLNMPWHIRNGHYYAAYDFSPAKNLSFKTQIIFKRHQHVSDSQGLKIVYGDSTRIRRDYAYVLAKSTALEEQITYEVNRHHLIFGVRYTDAFIQGNYVIDQLTDPEETARPEFSNTATRGEGNQFDTRNWGVFLQDIFKATDHLTVTLGGRYDHQRIRKTGGFGGVFNPRVGLVYLPTPALNVKMLYGRGYYAVENWALFSTSTTRLVPNPTLQPEKVNSVEMSVGYKFANHWFIEAAAYHNTYDGIVQAKPYTWHPVPTRPDSVIQTTRNEAAGKWTIYGGEARLRFSWRRWTANVNYSYTYPYNDDEDKKVGDIGANANFGLNWAVSSRLNWNMRANWADARETIATNPLGEIDSYLVVHTTFLVRDYLMKGLEISLTVNNLLDKEYFDPGVRTGTGVYASRLPQNDRNVFVRLTYSR